MAGAPAPAVSAAPKTEFYKTAERGGRAAETTQGHRIVAAPKLIGPETDISDGRIVWSGPTARWLTCMSTDTLWVDPGVARIWVSELKQSPSSQFTTRGQFRDLMWAVHSRCPTFDGFMLALFATHDYIVPVAHNVSFHLEGAFQKRPFALVTYVGLARVEIGFEVASGAQVRQWLEDLKDLLLFLLKRTAPPPAATLPAAFRRRHYGVEPPLACPGKPPAALTTKTSADQSVPAQPTASPCEPEPHQSASANGRPSQASGGLSARPRADRIGPSADLQPPRPAPAAPTR